uniref:Uncharacterized protein n=1 Tax=Geospiza parvula TaxID=87175 RepID=A0A8U8BVB4_GEOPR
MAEAHEGPRGRYVPYAPRSGRLANINITVKREPGERGGGAGRDGGRRSWFKITIPYGKKYDKSWLLSSIQNLCSVPFTPVEFHYDHNRAQFYVEDATTASALKQVSRKITDRDNYKSLQNELKPEEIEQLKLCMSKRYDGSQKALDLKSLRVDPDLVAQSIDVVLNQRSSMGVVLRIIEDNIPELQSLNLGSNRLFRLDDLAELPLKAPALKVLDLSRNELKSERELDKVKGLKLEELWLDGNPLCDSFRDQSSYIRSVLHTWGDGHELPPPIAFDVEAPRRCRPASFPLFTKIPVFSPRYYSVYDSSDRQGLLDAYHDGACCSLSIPYGPHTPPRNSLNEYFKDSRNVKKLKDPTMRFKLLKHTRLNVVAFLNELPKTQHDVNSFVVDICAQTNTLLCFTVHGIFKEVDGKSRDSVRAFTRMFIAVPAGNSGLCIVNDELFVRGASPEELRKAFALPTPTPSSSPVPTLSAEQQEMLAAFAMQSGMNLEWSQK